MLNHKKREASLTQELYRHARERIPGGTQLLSKRPERMAPGQWPAYYEKASGCETWDLDGNHYYDMSTNGIGSCLLGFRDSDVTRAVIERVKKGSMCTLNPPEEVELADLLCNIHPWAQKVRFTRTGGEACAVAIRVARATTGRSLIAVCGYHGWHDWYLACNLGNNDALGGHLFPGLEPIGVPKELRDTTTAFSYNNKDEFDAVINRYGDRLAAVIMEPCRNHKPAPGFLEYVKRQVSQIGALLIFDEITIGWRLYFGGAHLKLGVVPDIAVFAKAMGNGHPIGAVIGTEKAMKGAEMSFISSTYWTESVGPTAAIATIKKMKRADAAGHALRTGQQIIDYWKLYARKYRLPVLVEDDHPCLAHFKFQHEFGEELRTLYTQLMLEKDFLAGTTFYPTLAHTQKIVSLYGSAIDEVFAQIGDIIEKGSIKSRLKGPVAKSDFKRFL